MATPKQQSLCVISIQYQRFLLPVSDGLKLMELMQKAVSCEITWGAKGDGYQAGDVPDLSMQMVRADQVRMPNGSEVKPAPAASKRIGTQPLRLKGGM